MISRHLAVAMFGVASLAAARAAGAQSTEALGSYERPVQVQLSVATNSAFIGSQYGDQGGRLRAIDLATHFRTDGLMLMRLDAWAVDRRPRADNRTFDRLTKSLAVALVGSGEFPIRFPDDFSITPEVGFGWVPEARGQFLLAQGSTGGETRTSTGWVYSVGLTLRWRYFVIEQHLLQIVGADGALGNGETAPLSFGLRF